MRQYFIPPIPNFVKRVRIFFWYKIYLHIYTHFIFSLLSLKKPDLNSYRIHTQSSSTTSSRMSIHVYGTIPISFTFINCFQMHWLKSTLIQVAIMNNFLHRSFTFCLLYSLRWFWVDFFVIEQNKSYNSSTFSTDFITNW